MGKNRLEPNIDAFIKKCAEEIGQEARDQFYERITCECLEQEITSPIEQLLFTAMYSLAKTHDLPDREVVTISGEHYCYGFDVSPQRKIGKYRVDFFVSFERFPQERKPGIYQFSRSVIVECDSQEFHERTEEERRYEKTRDRFLQSEGYKVFRYTGREIVRDPMRVASEILSYVTNSNI